VFYPTVIERLLLFWDIQKTLTLHETASVKRDRKVSRHLKGNSRGGMTRMLRAKDIMTKAPITVTADMEILHAAKILLDKGINGVPVVDGERLVGILCQSDLIAQQKKLPIPSLFTFLDGFIPLKSTKHMEKALQKISATTVGDAMTPDPVTVQPETTLEELATFMVDKNFHTIPVVDKGKLVGVVGKEDVLRTLMSG
jgi:CBS domain-containing protein